MKSFEINHNLLIPGVYYHSQSGLVSTWDVRVKSPNKGDYLKPEVIHSIEHTLADFLRNRFGNYRIVGIFPMGCQTGFYVLTRFISKHKIHEAIKDYTLLLQRVITIPGNSERECGQCRLHDLSGAKAEMLHYYETYIKYSSKAIKYNK